MVIRIETGKSIRGVLNYNENKVANAEAALLWASGFPRAAERLSFNNKLAIFEMLTRQNERTKTNTLHITLNFSVEDKLDNELLQQIADDYMKGIGYGDQPYLVYRHYDAAHPHLHLATVNITQGGTRLETHNMRREASERTRKYLEETYNLVKAEQQKRELAYVMEPVDLKKALYGRQETKRAISAIVREVTRSYKFTSLPELNAILGQFGVTAYRGEPGSKMFEKKGLIYSLLSDKGERVGVPIKASSIYGKPTLPELEKKYSENKISRKPYGERLKFLLDRSIKRGRNREDFEQDLHNQGLRILFRKNVLGNIYGITFIDNATRVVYNGSDLGKQYGAKAFMERLDAIDSSTSVLNNAGEQSAIIDRHSGNDIDAGRQSLGQEEISVGSENIQYPAMELPAMQTLLDTLFYDEHEQSTYVPLKRKKKKRLQAE